MKNDLEITGEAIKVINERVKKFSQSDIDNMKAQIEAITKENKEKLEKEIGGVNNKLKELEEKLNNGTLTEEEKEQAEKDKKELEDKLKELEEAINKVPDIVDKEKNIGVIYSMYEDFRDFEEVERSKKYPSVNLIRSNYSLKDNQKTINKDNKFINLGKIDDLFYNVSFKIKTNKAEEFLLIGCPNYINSLSELDEINKINTIQFTMKNTNNIFETNRILISGDLLNTIENNLKNKNNYYVLYSKNITSDLSIKEIKAINSSDNRGCIFTENPGDDLSFAFPSYIGLQVKNKEESQSNKLSDYTTLKLLDFFNLSDEIEKRLTLKSDEASSPFVTLFTGNATTGDTIETSKSVFSDDFETVKFIFKTPYNTQVCELAFTSFISQIDLNTMIFSENNKQINYNSMKITTNKDNEKILSVLSVYENQHAYGKFPTSKAVGYLTKIIGVKKGM